ncbi:MAG: 30S ribosome-binding factor RbfA [Hyphomicrobiales bacterium]
MKKPPSQRQLRVGELIRHELSAIITRGEIDDDVIDHAGVSVNEVQTSPDLKIATAYVRPLLAGHEKEVVEHLNKHARFIRGLLAPKLGMRYMPELRFRYDTALDYAQHIDELLNSPVVRRDLDKPPSDEE